MSIRSKKLRIIIFFVFCLLLGFQKEIIGAEWISYASTGIGDFCYDNESVKQSSRNLIAVWIKLIPLTEDKRLAYIKNLKDSGINFRKIDDWKSDVSKWEINCEAKTYRTGGSTSYDKDGSVIDSNDSILKWNEIVPESQMESLYKILCEGKKFLRKQRKWKYYSSSDDGIYYYDESNMEKTSNSTVRIWKKEIIKEEARTNSIKSVEDIEDNDLKSVMREYYENCFYTIKLYQFDCSNKKKLLLLRSTSFNNDGIGFSHGDYTETAREGGLVQAFTDQQLANIACSKKAADQNQKGLKKKKSKD